MPNPKSQHFVTRTYRLGLSDLDLLEKLRLHLGLTRSGVLRQLIKDAAQRLLPAAPEQLDNCGATNPNGSINPDGGLVK